MRAYIWGTVWLILSWGIKTTKRQNHKFQTCPLLIRKFKSWMFNLWQFWCPCRWICTHYLIWNLSVAVLRPSVTNWLSKTFPSDQSKKEPFLVLVKSLFDSLVYTCGKKEMHPYYISPIEIGLFWAKITKLKNHSIAFSFSLQTDMKSIFHMRYLTWIFVMGLQRY